HSTEVDALDPETRAVDIDEPACPSVAQIVRVEEQIAVHLFACQSNVAPVHEAVADVEVDMFAELIADLQVHFRSEGKHIAAADTLHIAASEQTFIKHNG